MKSKKLTLGIVAHVDAGKTTLSEALLYLSGSIRKMGRVDHRNAFLDTFALERARGITIFSKQAIFELGEHQFTLLDTPGHVDFSAEMERTLQVLDYAILVINGLDGVQSHTMTLWRLLTHYQIPCFIFVNKMDQSNYSPETLMIQLKKRLHEHCIDFSKEKVSSQQAEEIAMCDDKLLEAFLENGLLADSMIAEHIGSRKIYPVFFGSALKLEGIEFFMGRFAQLLVHQEYPQSFGARVYKITRDEQGNRLSHLKITGGHLQVKDVITDSALREKVDQIRIYSGNQYRSVLQVESGEICAVTGLSETKAGDGLGIESLGNKPILKPVLTYRVLVPSEWDAHQVLMKLRILEEEEPHLSILWNEVLGEIHAQVMGEIEIEVLKSLIKERFQMELEFDQGSLVYKETIEEAIMGFGHFEPLKHYAEVHLLLEPGEPGSGLQFSSRCSEEELDGNWQRAVLSHLEEKVPIGVLIGAQLTDMKITLITGRGHLKHTEGGDFRQATFRALRQGLKKAKSRLLEPMYTYRLELPKEYIGRAMSDLQMMHGRFEEPIIDEEFVYLNGTAPVSTMRTYHGEVIAYSKGQGRLFTSFLGYAPCHNEKEIIALSQYDPDEDAQNPSSSIFCAHGAGFQVEWDQVEQYLHIENRYEIRRQNLGEERQKEEQKEQAQSNNKVSMEEDLAAIFHRTYGDSKRDQQLERSRQLEVQRRRFDSAVTKEETLWEVKKVPSKEKYLLVDGYNIIFAWEDLRELATSNMDGARNKLQDLLCNYQSYQDIYVIVVYDAYRVQGGRGESFPYHNIHIIYTKEAETADQYIEKLVHKIGRTYEVTVATSDALEQMIILGKGGMRLSAEGLRKLLESIGKEIREQHLNQQDQFRNYPFRQ